MYVFFIFDTLHYFCSVNMMFVCILFSPLRFLIGQYVTLHGDVVSHVNISRVRVEDGGQYKCKASNRAGEMEHRARLNIYGEDIDEND